MQQKNLLILSVVTVLALALAALALRSQDSSAASSVEQGLLFPELSERINDLAELRIEKAGKSVTLQREGGQWKLVDRGGYPAEFTKVKELAMRLASLEIEEKKTAKKSNHAALGVEWPSTAEEGSEAEAGLVTLKDAGGNELAAMVIGKSEWRGSNPKVFVRPASEDQVYLCSPRGSLDASPEAKNWIEPKFLELENDRVQDVRILHADGEKITVGRSAANHTQFTLQNLAPGMTEKYEGVANGVAQALGYGLTLEDVRPAAEVDFAAEPVAKTRFRCTDGLELLLELAKFEEKTWIKVSASFTAPPEPAEPPATEGEGEEGSETETADAPAEEPEKDGAAEAAELNERLAPWAFAVGDYKTDALARRLKDLLAEPAATSGEGDSLQSTLQELGLDPSELNEPAHDEAGGQEDQAEAMEPTPTEDDEGEPIPVSDEGEPE